MKVATYLSAESMMSEIRFLESDIETLDKAIEKGNSVQVGTPSSSTSLVNSPLLLEAMKAYCKKEVARLKKAFEKLKL